MFLKKWIQQILWVLLAMLPLTILFQLQTANATTLQPESVEFLVKYKTDVRSLANSKASQKAESREIIAEQVELLTFSETEDFESIQQELKSDPTIEVVEPNYQHSLFATVNDPYLSQQWWIPHIEAPSFWSFSTAQKKNTVVAVIDSGIDFYHEDLQGRIEPGGYNFYNNNTNVTDNHGHGTMVAGVIAAEVNNGRGIAGVAGSFDITVLPLKVSGTDGNSYVSDVIKAIDYAIDKDVDVINLSLGGPNSSTLENEAVQRAIQKGIVVVASAGNDALEGNFITYPASYNNVLSIGAVDRNNHRAEFSNYNKHVDLVAPGKNIYTTSYFNSYEYVSGTSFSAPIVAGTVAMAKAINPTISLTEVKDLLQSAAIDLGAPGIDKHFGAGVLSIERLAEKLHPVEEDLTVSGVSLHTKKITFNLDKLKEQRSIANPTVNKQLESTFLFEQLFMEVGETEPFLLNMTTKSEILSSDPSVATIDKDGNVQAIGHGTTIISYSGNNKYMEAVIKVARKTDKPTSVLFEKVLPENATNKAVRWSSSNPKVAKVDEHGIITAEGIGTAEITVTTVDGGYTERAEVVVNGTVPGFIGDFPAMKVDTSKIFTITFNQPLIEGNDYSKDIIISRSPDGEETISTFTATVNPETPTQLLITPNSTWDFGKHYMTITNNLKNANHIELKKEVNMKFSVDDVTAANELSQYENMVNAMLNQN